MANTFINAYADVTTTDTAVYTNNSGGKAIVLTCRVTNIDGINDATVNARILDSDNVTDAKIAYLMDVPKATSIELAGVSKLVLENGDDLWLQASADGDLEAFLSILEIT